MRKPAKNYNGLFQTINKAVSDNRKFGKTICPLFSEKPFHKEMTTLKYNTRIITNNHELAETFNSFFNNVIQDLKIDNK